MLHGHLGAGAFLARPRPHLFPDSILEHAPFAHRPDIGPAILAHCHECNRCDRKAPPVSYLVRGYHRSWTTKPYNHDLISPVSLVWSTRQRHERLGRGQPPSLMDCIIALSNAARIALQPAFGLRKINSSMARSISTGYFIARPSYVHSAVGIPTPASR